MIKRLSLFFYKKRNKTWQFNTVTTSKTGLKVLIFSPLYKAMFANNWEINTKHLPNVLLKAPTQPILHISIKIVAWRHPGVSGDTNLDTNSTRTPRRQKDAGSPRMSSGPGSGNVKYPAVTSLREKKRKQLYSPHNWLVVDPTENFTVLSFFSMAGNFRRLPQFPADFSPENFCNGWWVGEQIRGCAEDSWNFWWFREAYFTFFYTV